MDILGNCTYTTYVDDEDSEACGTWFRIHTVEGVCFEFHPSEYNKIKQEGDIETFVTPILPELLSAHCPINWKLFSEGEPNGS